MKAVSHCCDGSSTFFISAQSPQCINRKGGTSFVLVVCYFYLPSPSHRCCCLAIIWWTILLKSSNIFIKRVSETVSKTFVSGVINCPQVSFTTVAVFPSIFFPNIITSGLIVHLIAPYRSCSWYSTYLLFWGSTPNCISIRQLKQLHVYLSPVISH